MEIYAPIAHRLGMGKMRGELEDLAFSYLEPEAYQEIKKSVESRQKVRQELLDEVKNSSPKSCRSTMFPGLSNLASNESTASTRRSSAKRSRSNRCTICWQFASLRIP
jgi:hypothetical protein